MLANLESLFSSTARVQILRLFLSNPDRPFYQREIERETGQPIRAVQREVKRLSEMDLLLRSVEGNRVFYHVNADFPVLAELTALFQQAGIVKDIKEAPTGTRQIPPEPSTICQPFSWMETPPQPSLPQALRRTQVEGEWDRAY